MAAAAVMVPAPRPSVDAVVDVLPELYVPEARQWLSMSAGRIAPEGYSWMQAVHWVARSGLYRPRRYRSHGPRSFGPTTVLVAQLLAELSPCRPGVEYLMRRTGLSERAVQNHLQMLRETGLLAYVSKGTRVSGGLPQASEFARVIPVEFDEALGIRTVGEGAGRRMTGIAEAGRELMARLAKLAARKVRRRSTTSSRTGSKAVRKSASGAGVTAVSGGSRCTPMGGGADGSSTAGTTSFPPENKLASGGSKSPVPNKSKAGGRRKLNSVGRRFQLARELTQELDWLRGCSVPRIAWVARHVADAGWTVTDVKGWLHLRGEAARVRRGSGLLAVLLSNAVTVLDTPEKRAAAVEQWRGAQEAARRHRIQQVRAHTERCEGDWQAPSSRSVQREVEAAFAQVRETLNGSRHQDLDAAAEPPTPTEAEMVLLHQEAEQRLAVGDTSLIVVAIDAMGRETAERVYGEHLVHRALQLESCSRSSLMTIGHP